MPKEYSYNDHKEFVLRRQSSASELARGTPAGKWMSNGAKSSREWLVYVSALDKASFQEEWEVPLTATAGMVCGDPSSW